MELILNFLQKSDSALPPNSEVQLAIDEVLWSGLNIGLLAEWRAWSFVSDFLKNQSTSNYPLGEKTIWLNKFKDIESKSERHAEIFKYISTHFKNKIISSSEDQSSKKYYWINDERVQQRLIILRACITEKIISGQPTKKISDCKTLNE